jgi:hypothetical protein
LNWGGEQSAAERRPGKAGVWRARDRKDCDRRFL